MQQTYRRLASTSRSASSSMHTHTHAPYPQSTLSRSSSTASNIATMSPTTVTPVDVGGSFGRINSLRNSSFATSTSDYTRAELETIAESLLAHVHFGPYHLASSPVPSSHLRHAMSTTNAVNTSTSSSSTVNANGGGGAITSSSAKENTALSGSSTSITSLYESTTPTLGQLGGGGGGGGGGPRYGGPSSRRHFEGKEGPLRTAARFTIGESERGRGIARKSVGLSMRDVNHNSNNNNNNDYDHYERGRRENRGRSGSVKGLQYS